MATTMVITDIKRNRCGHRRAARYLVGKGPSPDPRAAKQLSYDVGQGPVLTRSRHGLSRSD